jgi:serine/threonine-protein kinase
VTRSIVTLPAGASLNFRGTQDTWSKIGFSQLVAISRDGQRLVYTGQRGRGTNLYVKDKAGFAPKLVRGTRGARGGFFSPDGNWVGFLSESTVWKVRLPGGTPQPVCEVNSAAFDATWLDDDSIVFAIDHGLRRVASGGGEVEELTRVEIDGGERGHCFPHAVPGSDLIIFTLVTESGRHAAVLSSGDSTPHVIKRHAAGARYSGSGHLVFARGDEVLAAPYDPADPRTVGTDETRIVTGVHASPGQGGAVVHLFATSQAGTLAYAPRAAAPEPDSLVWVDQEGNEELIVSGEGSWMHQRLSPVSDAVLFNRLTSDGMNDLNIYDRNRDQINPLTRIGHVYDAEWSPDGEMVGFNALDRWGRSMNIIRADDGLGRAECIFEGSNSRPHFCQWSAHEPTLLFFNRAAEGGLWKSTLEDGKWQPLELVMNSPRREAWAQISPDGQLIAYVGFERDGRQVFVQTYPERGALVRVSNDGGGEPLWANDSRTLYFREAGKIYRATISTAPVLDSTEPEALPIEDTYDSAASGHQHYDISRDGTRFLMVKHGQRFNPNTLHVLENWPDELGGASSP